MGYIQQILLSTKIIDAYVNSIDILQWKKWMVQKNNFPIFKPVPMGTQGYYPKKSMGMGWVGLGLSLNSMSIFLLGTQRGL